MENNTWASRKCAENFAQEQKEKNTAQILPPQRPKVVGGKIYFQGKNQNPTLKNSSNSVSPCYTKAQKQDHCRMEATSITANGASNNGSKIGKEKEKGKGGLWKEAPQLTQ